MSWNLSFITRETLKSYTAEIITKYNENAKSIKNIVDFNKNTIDPIKIIFDHKIYQRQLEDVIKSEIDRQIDKSNNNAIGYFHQNIFKYIPHCQVPKEGFDIIFTDPKDNQKYFIELKNKHNTMNSNSSNHIYITMQNKLLQDPHAKCLLVEVIAHKSQDIAWSLSINNKKISSERIRRMSIDKFYELVTKDPLAFYKLCSVLPDIIEDLIDEQYEQILLYDTILGELAKIHPNIIKALYLLAFKTYAGLSSETESD